MNIRELASKIEEKSGKDVKASLKKGSDKDAEVISTKTLGDYAKDKNKEVAKAAKELIAGWDKGRDVVSSPIKSLGGFLYVEAKTTK